MQRQIDEYLTEECFFCGNLLIDMIDNDIKILNKKHIVDPDFDDIVEENNPKQSAIDE